MMLSDKRKRKAIFLAWRPLGIKKLFIEKKTF